MRNSSPLCIRVYIAKPSRKSDIVNELQIFENPAFGKIKTVVKNAEPWSSEGGKMKHIVHFSGGKDSTAMLLMMIAKGIHIDDIIFCDTGMEFPEM